MAYTTLQGQWINLFGVTGGNGAGVAAGFYPGSPFPSQNMTMSFGTTTNQCNAATMITTSVTAGSTRSIDLSTLKALDGTSMVLTTVKTLQAAVTASGTTATDPVYTMGPSGVANGAVLGFGATQAAVDVRFGGYDQKNLVSGWGVTASNKLLVLTNPGAYDVTAAIFITGTT